MDEMGLGKTLQCIAFISWLKKTQNLSGPFLILAPKSTLTNWMREFQNWAPSINAFHFHGDRKLQPDKFEVVVTSYEMVTKEAGAFRKFAWRYIIVDEAHRMKNEQSVLSQVLRSLSSHSRLLVTGTPLQNNLHGL
ncbi:SNF2 family N-terminal domain-containing protein [Pavlovales sp. CCMP2436]|nr:SNF2 family N-terminal domain-containing protein [Pavlovales sp. CCMP2436]